MANYGAFVLATVYRVGDDYAVDYQDRRWRVAAGGPLEAAAAVAVCHGLRVNKWVGGSHGAEWWQYSLCPPDLVAG